MTDTPETDEIEVDLTDAPELAAPEDGAAAAPEPSKVVETDDGIEAIKARLAAVEAERDAANARAQTAAQAATQAATDVRQSEINQVSGAIEQVKQRAPVLEAQLAEALAAGDAAAIAKVQRLITRDEAALIRLEDGLEALKKAPPPKPVIADPVERMIAEWGMSPESANFIRQHPSLINRPNALIAAHNLAVEAGLRYDSPEYFAHAERTLGLASTDARPQAAAKTPDVEPTSDAAAAPAGGRSTSPAAAPVSRSAPGVNGRQIVRLTAEEREMAATLGISEQDYARNKVALQREGKLAVN